MSKRGYIVGKVLVALVFIGLLTVGGWAIYRAGWSHGYLAAGSEEKVTLPHPHAFAHPGRWPGFAPLGSRAGLLFMFGAFVLLLLLIGGLFHLAGRACLHAKMAGGPMSWHWHRPHGHEPCGPMPPWGWYWKQPPEEKSGKAENDG